MGKYLELFLGEVGDLTEKTKLENKPYVCYSTKLGKVTYTVVPAKDPVVEGPADNEIWYTTVDGNPIDLSYYTSDFYWGANIVSNTYNEGRGVIVFDDSVTRVSSDDTESGPFSDSSLTSIILPDSIVEVAYAGLKLPSTYCDHLELPNNIEKINAYGIFMEVDPVAVISIPVSLRYLELNSIINWCYSPIEINYSGTKENWNSIEKHEQWNPGNNQITVHCTDGDIVYEQTSFPSGEA